MRTDTMVFSRSWFATLAAVSFVACGETTPSGGQDAGVTPPGAPTVSSVAPASPANDNDPTVSGTAEAGSEVKLFAAAACSGDARATGIAGETGAFAIAVHVADDSTSTFWASASNAGGSSACSTTSVAFVEDSTAPAAPALISSFPGPISNTTTTLDLVGTAEAGAAVAIYTTSDCTGTPAGLGTAADNRSFTIAATAAANASTTFYAKATDAAGNASACSAAGLTFIHDNLPPEAPEMTGTVPASPSNASTTPDVSGTAEADASVDIYATADCSGTALATAVAAGDGSFGVQVTVQANHTTILSARATDVAGNVSGCSSLLTFVHDSQPPAPPSFTGTAPVSPGHGTSPVVSGLAEAGAAVAVFASADCSGTAAETVTAGTTGAFAANVTVQANDTTILSATATDAAGNPSNCGSAFQYVEDSIAPTAPATNLAAGEIMRGSSLFSASSSDVHFDRMDLYVDDFTTPVTPLADDGAGSYAAGVDISSVADGSHTVRFLAWDQAGNSSSTDVVVRFDNTPPSFNPSLSTPLDGDLLSDAEGAAQLPNATFVFDDYDLDEAAVNVAVTYRGSALAEGTHFTVDRATPNTIKVAVNVAAIKGLGGGQAGERLAFALTNIVDRADSNLTFGSQPNVGADVAVAVTYDFQPPFATLLFNPGGNAPQNARAIVRWNEAMSAASASTFTFTRLTAPTGNVAVEPTNGSGFFGLSAPGANDAFYFVPADLLAPGVNYAFDASNFTDAAGNRTQGNAASAFTVWQPLSMGLKRVDFVTEDDPVGAPGVFSVHGSVPGEYASKPAYLIPLIAGTSYELLAVFDRDVSTDPGMGGGPRAELAATASFGDCRVQGTPVRSGDSPNVDAMRFDPSGLAACSSATWVERAQYRLSMWVMSVPIGNNIGWWSREQLLVVPVNGGSDVTRPTLTSVAGFRGVGDRPVLRPGEPLVLGFSESLEPERVQLEGYIEIRNAADQVVPSDATLGQDKATSLIVVRPRVRLAPGAYTLRLRGLTDVVVDGFGGFSNVILPVDYGFDVAPLDASRAPSFLWASPDSAEADLPSWMQPLLAFDDAIARETVSDTGPVRGFRFEEKMGDAFLPLKGLGPRNDNNSRTYETQIFGLGQMMDMNGNVFREGGEYRLTLLPGLTSADGVALASPPSPIIFKTAPQGYAGNYRPLFDGINLHFTQFSGGPTSPPREFELSARVNDPNDTDTWTLTLDRMDAPTATFSVTPSPASRDPRLTLSSAQIDSLFPAAGAHRLRATISDQASATSAATATLWILDDSTLSAATPIVTGASGRYDLAGTVTRAEDAARIHRIFVVIVDLDSGGNMVGMALMEMAQVTRNADGTLAYAFSMAPDRALGAPIGSYIAAALLEVPALVGAGDTIEGISDFVAVPFP